MGKVRVGASVAGIAAAAIAGTLIDAVPAQWVFAGAALLSLPGSLAFFRIEHTSHGGFGTRRPALDIARDVWRDRRYRRLLISFLVFGWGNLMNFAVFPIMLVDHFDAPNTFVGILSAAQSATMIVAYVVVGKLIDRGSTLRQTLIGTLLVMLVPIGYIVAPTYWALLPIAVVGGFAQASASSRISPTWWSSRRAIASPTTPRRNRSCSGSAGRSRPSRRRSSWVSTSRASCFLLG
jgi:MFS family permease